MKFRILLVVFLLLGAGCIEEPDQQEPETETEETSTYYCITEDNMTYCTTHTENKDAADRE